MIELIENEVWVDVREFEGYYKVSSLTRVKRLYRESPTKDGKLKKLPERLMSQSNSLGYMACSFRVGAHVKQRKVHRMIAEAFIPNPDNKPHINHINGDRSDNRIENLEWCTSAENAIHAFRVIKTRKSPFKGRTWGVHHPCNKKVKCDTLDIIFRSGSEAAKCVGLSISKVRRVLQGMYPHVDGLTFRYI